MAARADAQRRIYRLSDGGLDEIDEWLKGVQKFWSQRLDRLEQVLNEPEPNEETGND